MEAIAADTKVAVGLPGRGHGFTMFEKRRFIPAEGSPHFFRGPCVERFKSRVPTHAVENVDELFLGQIAQRRLGLQAARIDIPVGLDRHFRAQLSVFHKVQPAGPAVAEIIIERGAGEFIVPGPSPGPDRADPFLGIGPHHRIDRGQRSAPIGAVMATTGRLQSRSLEHGGQLFDQRQAFIPLMADMKVIHPGDRNLPDPVVNQFVEDLRGHQIARGLHHNAHPALIGVFGAQHIHHRIKHRLADRVE